ncbi:MAG: glycosyltransferase family 2 protein [Acetobacteraceae bacterium]
MAARLRLSVIIPNRNHSALLPRSLGAMVRQRRQPDEIIVIDDASTDNSREVIRSFMPLLPQLRLLENPERLGAAGALNRGLREATGDAMYCGAADDSTDPDFVEVVLGALERNPEAGLACAEARLISEDGAFLGFRPASMPLMHEGFASPAETAALLRRLDNWVLTVVTILRRDRMLNAGGFDETLGPFCDGFMARRIALESGFVFIPRVLGTWFVQTGSYSRSSSMNPETMAELIAIVSERMKAAEGAPFPPGYSGTFNRRARFACARLAAMEPNFDADLVCALMQGGSVDSAVLAVTGSLPGQLRRLATLGWLTVRLRPTSLVRLVRSSLYRLLKGYGNLSPR